MSKHDLRLVKLEKLKAPRPELPPAPGVIHGIGRTEREVKRMIERRRAMGYDGPILIVDR